MNTDMNIDMNIDNLHPQKMVIPFLWPSPPEDKDQIAISIHAAFIMLAKPIIHTIQVQHTCSLHNPSNSHGFPIEASKKAPRGHTTLRRMLRL